MNTLNEEIKKFKLLSSYDTNLTLSENYEINFINEQSRGLFVKLLGGDIKALSSTVKDFSIFKGNATNAENFIKNAAAGKAAAKDLAAFTKDVLKDGSRIKNANPGLFDGAVESYSKNLFNNNKDKVATQFKNASEADRLALLKNSGYPEATANAVVKNYKDLEVAAGTVTKDASTVTKNTGTVTKDASTVTKDASTVTKDAGTVTKDAEAVAKESKNTANNLKNDSSFLEKFKKVKNWPWKDIRKWALRLGIAGAVIWYFMKDSGDPLPPEFPDTPPVDGGGGGTGGGTGGGSKYTSCPETFPISQNCKNNKIKEIQACLNMPAKYQTGNFGTITQGYLERAGVSGTEITQDSYDKVCNKTTTTSTPFEDDEDEDTDLNQTSTTSTKTTTTSTDDEEVA